MEPAEIAASDALLLSGSGIGILPVDRFEDRIWDLRSSRSLLHDLRACLEAAPWPSHGADGRGAGQLRE
jgi:hypothetical protein